MKMPKEINRYCPHCREHHTHTVKRESGGKTSPFKKRHRKAQRKIEKGYGSFPFEDPAHLSRGRKNPSSEKIDLKFICSECRKAHKPKNPPRAASFEIE